MPPLTLEDIYAKQEQFIEMRPDLYMLMWLTLAVPISLRFDEGPVWVLIIGGPSSGKSLTLSTILKSIKTYWIDDLTSKTFLSGYRDEKFEEKNNGTRKEVSIAKQLPGKTLIIPDMTKVLTKGKESEEIMNQLRLMYDGYFKKAFGNDVVEKVEGTFNFLGACTEVIDHIATNAIAMGERFLSFRLSSISQEHQYKIGRMSQDAKVMSQFTKYGLELADMCSGFIERAKITKPTQPERYKDEITSLANFVTAFRASEARDTFNKGISTPPTDEASVRVVKQFHTLSKGLAAVKRKAVVTREEMNVIRKLTISTIPAVRRLTLSLLAKRYYVDHQNLGHRDLADMLRVSDRNALQCLYGLYNIKIIDKDRVTRIGGSPSWKLSDRSIELIDKANVWDLLLEEF